ncbi:MAG: TonB-dependent receptor plug domain-containing protein [Pseudomonadota bacterium]
MKNDTLSMKVPDAEPVRRGRSFSVRTAAAVAALCLSAPMVATAQDDVEEDEVLTQETVVVTGSLRALPVEDVGSVFGFDKNIVEIPRAVSTISSDQIERFGITDIYGLVAQAPGTFTNSFFGVGGALDIRGQAGETYFRGVRRLDNPGNYPTPIGASDRIDIVRGPASPIYGPSKSGGYMNFVPKTARLGSGQYADEASGEIRYTGGSWDKSVLAASVTGPGEIGGQQFGYHLYAEVEDSGSFYENIGTEQTILQSAFDTDLTDEIRLEFGAMYHDYKGKQNGGWNRVTQDLIDNGTYITGTAQPLDTDFDGELSPGEFLAVGDFNPFFLPFGTPLSGVTDAAFADSPFLALENTGTAQLSRSNVIQSEDDTLENEMLTLYFDVIYENDMGLEIKNQMFYEGYENLNENDYGFSQFHDSWVFENKLVITKAFELEWADITAQVSPSVRHTDFLHGDDFFFEYFHRVDLTQGFDARSNRLLSTEENANFSNYVEGNYTNYAIAGLVDIETDFGLNFLLGLREDVVDAESTAFADFEIFRDEDLSASDEENGTSWNVSVSYEIPGTGIIPYFTAAEQTVVVAGQGAEISPEALAQVDNDSPTGEGSDQAFLSATELTEFGIKGNFLDDRLYAAIAYYEQERTDRNIQSITVNQDIQTEGIEAELRWAVTDKFLVTASYTNTEVVNLSILEAGSQFSFLGAEDLSGVDPTLHYGGQPGGLVSTGGTRDDAKRAGIPENLYSLTATYEFDNGLALSGSVTDVEEVFSGQSQAVTLPAYTLVDLGASYEFDNWLLRVNILNATDEEYFRANFTELFGSTIVLPERPRSVQASVIFKF